MFAIICRARKVQVRAELLLIRSDAYVRNLVHVGRVGQHRQLYTGVRAGI